MAVGSEAGHWAPVLSGSRGGWRPNRASANLLQGAQSIVFSTGGGASDEVTALVRTSRDFRVRRGDSLHALWIKFTGSNLHYLHVFARNQSAAATPGEVAASDLTAGNQYSFRVNRFHQVEILRGPIALAQTKIYPAGASVISPSLAAVNGGYHYRFKVKQEGAGVRLNVYQTLLSAPSVHEDADWTLVDGYLDASAGRIDDEGYAGLALLNGGTNRNIFAVDRYADAAILD